MFQDEVKQFLNKLLEFPVLEGAAVFDVFDHSLWSCPVRCWWYFVGCGLCPRSSGACPCRTYPQATCPPSEAQDHREPTRRWECFRWHHSWSMTLGISCLDGKALPTTGGPLGVPEAPTGHPVCASQRPPPRLPLPPAKRVPPAGH